MNDICICVVIAAILIHIAALRHVEDIWNAVGCPHFCKAAENCGIVVGDDAVLVYITKNP